MKRRFYDRFGTRRGFVLTSIHRVAYILGAHRCSDVNWEQVERLVFVCKGNICRSAHAEAVATSVGINSISGGICAIEGASANEQAIKTAQHLGFDLKHHRTTPIMYPILSNTDLLVSMEPWQNMFLSKHLPGLYQSTLLGIWGKPALPYIYDPYGRSEKYFEHCFSYIERAVHAIIKKIKN